MSPRLGLPGTPGAAFRMGDGALLFLLPETSDTGMAELCRKRKHHPHTQFQPCRPRPDPGQGWIPPDGARCPHRKFRASHGLGVLPTRSPYRAPLLAQMLSTVCLHAVGPFGGPPPAPCAPHLSPPPPTLATPTAPYIYLRGSGLGLVGCACVCVCMCTWLN